MLRTHDESAGLARQAVVSVRVQRQLGLLDLRAGRVGQARDRFERAIEQARHEDLQYELALTLASAVSGFDASFDPDDEAGSVFERLGVERSGYEFVLAR